MKVVIALGSNVPNGNQQPHALIEVGVAELAKIIEITHLSTIIETEPVGGPEQPNYQNAVAIGESTLDPVDLLRFMHEIEAKLGRVRDVRWGPRTLDLDLIVAGDIVVESEELVLPHPRAHERGFVLQPWNEIDPDGFIPGKGDVASLLAALNQAE